MFSGVRLSYFCIMWPEQPPHPAPAVFTLSRVSPLKERAEPSLTPCAPRRALGLRSRPSVAAGTRAGAPGVASVAGVAPLFPPLPSHAATRGSGRPTAAAGIPEAGLLPAMPPNSKQLPGCALACLLKIRRSPSNLFHIRKLST